MYIYGYPWNPKVSAFHVICWCRWCLMVQCHLRVLRFAGRHRLSRWVTLFTIKRLDFEWKGETVPICHGLSCFETGALARAPHQMTVQKCSHLIAIDGLPSSGGNIWGFYHVVKFCGSYPQSANWPTGTYYVIDIFIYVCKQYTLDTVW